MANVIGITQVGGAYKRGMYHPGWNYIHLDNGEKVYVGESGAKGFDSLLDYAESLGHSASDYRTKLDHWVKTGTFPQ